jgi:DNA-binding LacI/PurR family transcriptional regulator
MVEIAEKAGVSAATVGFVLNGAGKGSRRVSDKTAIRVRQIAKDLNYRPNQIARQLVGKGSKTIGVLIDPNPSESNSIRLAQITIHARECGYHTMTLHEKPDPQLVSECMDEFTARGVDGLICVHHVYPGKPDLVAKIVDSAITNVVFIDEPAIKNATYIGTDYVDGTAQAVKYLHAQKKRRIGLALSDVQWYSGPRIRQGYIQGMRELGIKLDENLIWIGDQDVNSDLEHISPGIAGKILDDLVLRERVDAIIACDDFWSAQLLNELSIRGVHVPNDVALIGLGNYHISDYTRPALTSMDLQYEYIARTSVDMLLKMIDSEKKYKPERILVKPKLVIRASA